MVVLLKLSSNHHDFHSFWDRFGLPHHQSPSRFPRVPGDRGCRCHCDAHRSLREGAALPRRTNHRSLQGRSRWCTSVRADFEMFVLCRCHLCASKCRFGWRIINMSCQTRPILKGWQLYQRFSYSPGQLNGECCWIWSLRWISPNDPTRWGPQDS